VICGGPTKVIETADWSSLDTDEVPPAIDTLDVADVESEQDHAYESPAPNGGWTIMDVLPTPSGVMVFDGGRIVPAGERESFRARASSKSATLVLRSDDVVDATVEVAGTVLELSAPKAQQGWTAAETASFAISDGERVVIHARAPLRDFHVWIVPGL